GGYRLTQPERGDSVDELLRYVHFAPERLLENYKGKLEAAGVNRDESRALFRELEAGLHGYTYFED
ncbi:MAG: arginine decarboxylase, partial [Candidatus Sedimenticola sp. 20ELBAFRAG]